MQTHTDVHDSIINSIDELRKLEAQEYYRFIVPGLQHSEGEGWLRFEERNPNALPAAFEALSFAFTRLNRFELTPILIQHIHYRLTMNVEMHTQLKLGELRKDENGFYLAKHLNFVSKQGFTEFYLVVNDALQKYGAALSVVRSDYLDHLTSRKDASDRFKRIAHVKNAKRLFEAFKRGKSILYRAPRPDNLQVVLAEVCKFYNQNIQVSEESEKLIVIASCIQMIERLHIFPDGNGRTSLILLQRLLLQNGFLPAMLRDPDCIDGYSLEELVKEIKRGCLATRKIMTVPDYPLYGYRTQLIGHAYPDANTQTDEEFFRNLRMRGVQVAIRRLKNFIDRLRYDSRDALKIEPKPKFKLGRFLATSEFSFWKNQQIQALQHADTNKYLIMLHAFDSTNFNLTLCDAFLTYYQVCIKEYYAQVRSCSALQLKQKFLKTLLAILPYVDSQRRREILLALSAQENSNRRFLNAHRNDRFYAPYVDTESWQHTKALLRNRMTIGGK